MAQGREAVGHVDPIRVRNHDTPTGIFTRKEPSFFQVMPATPFGLETLLDTFDGVLVDDLICRHLLRYSLFFSVFFNVEVPMNHHRDV